MKRTYLEEDIELIQKYFPGARTVNLRTPFDLTRAGGPARPSTFRELNESALDWNGAALWTS